VDISLGARPAALINFRYMGSARWSTDEAVRHT
jgi:hypothetical protein